MNHTLVANLMLEIDKLESNGIHVIFLATESSEQGIKAMISKTSGWGESFANNSNLIDAFQQHCFKLSNSTSEIIETDCIVSSNSEVIPDSTTNISNIYIAKDNQVHDLDFRDLNFQSECGNIFEEVEEGLEDESPIQLATDNENTLECYTCGKAFYDFEELITHMNEHNVIDDTRLTCPLCGLAFDNQQLYAEHDESVHTHVFDVVYQSLLDTNTEDLHKELENNFLPNISTSTSKQAHASGIRLEVVNIPNLSFNRIRQKKREDLNCVMTICSNKKVGYECTICNRVIYHRSHFDLHMRSHRDERPFECYDCGKKYLAIQHLNRHIQSAHRTNQVAKDFKVDDFKSEDDEKVFICQECGRQFNRSHNLKVHILRHEMSSKGLKPEMCHVCGKQFRTKHCLKVHQSSHHAEKTIFKCSQCDKNFFTRTSRLCHIDRRHGIMCSFCSTKFNDADERNKHEKVMHNIRYEYVRKSLSEGKITPAY